MSTITVSNGQQTGPTAPDRLTILKAIFGEFERMCQSTSNNVCWPAPDWTKDVYESSCRANALMSLLEVHDCGSYGGFDKECAQNGNLTFIERFVWLVKKYGHENDLDDRNFTFAMLLKRFRPRQDIHRVNEPITKKKSKIGAARG